MTKDFHVSRLIPNRLAAAIAVVLTGSVTATAIGDAVLHPEKRPTWLLSWFFGMPHWALLAVNVALYGYVLWVCAGLFRLAQHKERIVVAGWILGFVLYPVERFASTLRAVARYVEAAAMGIAFLAALSIFLSFFRKDLPQAGAAEDS